MSRRPVPDLGHCQCPEEPHCTTTPTQEDLLCGACRRPNCEAGGLGGWCDLPQPHVRRRLDWCPIGIAWPQSSARCGL